MGTDFHRTGLIARHVCAAGILMLTVSVAYGADNVRRDTSIQFDEAVSRENVPKALFGFNVPWVNFQRGYWREQHVRREIIDWLRPFEGAVYRYPGGDISNWFDWRPTVRAREHRARQYAKYGQYETARFGFDEYIEFVKEVNGVPLVTVNLLGLEGPKREEWDAQTAGRVAAEWVRYSKKFQRSDDPSSLTSCSKSKGCNVLFWELGNELDVGRTKWSGDRYVRVAKHVAQEMRRANDAIIVIPHTNTHPWNQTKRAFSRDVVEGLDELTSTFSIHAYYGIRGVPRAIEYVSDLETDLSTAAVAGASIAVTEHARWPWSPGEPVSPYGPTWLKTGDVWGALDTADFILAMALRPRVVLATWHALGAEGPWQLFYVDKQDRLAPNVVYWAMRVLREGWRDKASRAVVTGPNTSGGPGPTDVSALLMTSSGPPAGRSLMIVNRASAVNAVRVTIPGARNQRISATHVFLSGESPEQVNTPAEPGAVQMQRKTVAVEFDASGTASFEVPKLSVNAYIWEGR